MTGCRANRPPVGLCFRVRADAGWVALTPVHAKTALAASLICATAYAEGRAIGFVRAVGDGIMYFYICDLIVDEAYRGQGIATALMEHLMQQIGTLAPQGATLALMSAEGMEALYKKFGFVARPNDGYGAGMTLFLEPSA